MIKEQLIDNLKHNGITLYQNCLDKNEINFLQTVILRIRRSKGEKGSHLPFKMRSYLIKIFKGQFQEIKLALYLNKLSKKLNLKEISNIFFQNETELIDIDYYVSEKSNKPVLDWHVDNAYSGRGNVSKFVKAEDYGLKFIFYLTDVSKNNGCLEYVPFSNKIAFALKKAIYNGEIKYEPYWKLEDFCRLVLKHEKIILNYVDQSTYNNFLNEIKKLKDNKNIKYFSYETKKGSAVIFDESGLHKGTSTNFNDRIVFRFIFKVKK